MKRGIIIIRLSQLKSRIGSYPVFWGALACLFGITLGICFLGTHILNPTEINSLMAGGDSTASFLGWLYYRRSAWFFPLTNFDTLLYPEGTTTILTDSMPILTVVFKAFRSVLPESFQYFGLWIVSCFALMSLSGWLLARVLGYSLPGALAVAALFALSPPLWDRVVHHHALAMQWFIVLLFYIYFKANATQHGRFSIIGITLLNLLVIGVNPYLSAMALALTLSCFLNAAVKGGRNNLRWCLMGVLALASCMVVFPYVLGYFSLRNLGEAGFGYYKTDLLTPFSPNSAPKSFSRLLPQIIPASPAESRGYIGSAPMILLAISLLRFRPRWFRGAVEKGYAPLIVGVLVLWVYALATPISIAGRPIVSMNWLYSKLGPLPDMFRSSERFGWPLTYLLITFSLMCARYWARKRAVFVLWILIAFQLWDMCPRLQGLRQVSLERAAFQIRPLPLPSASSKLHAYLLPRFSSPRPGRSLSDTRTEFNRLAFAINEAHLKFNSGRTDRRLMRDAINAREEQTRAFRSGNPDPDGIYIFYSPQGDPEGDPELGEAKVNCTRQDSFVICQ